MSERRSHTPAEKRWCMETICAIQDDLPYQYCAEVQLILRRKGIARSDAYIHQVKRLVRFDVDVVKAFQNVARRYSPSKFIGYTEDDIRRKIA